MPTADTPLPTRVSDLPPHFWVFAADAGVVLAAWLLAWWLSRRVARFCRQQQLDRLASPPWKPGAGVPPGGEQVAAIWWPSSLALWLCWLSVGLAAAWILARMHANAELAETSVALGVGLWTLALVTLVAWAGARALAAAACDLIALPRVRQTLDGGTGDPHAPTLSQAVARLVGLAIYGVVALLALAVVADQFRWLTLGLAVGALWELVVRAMAALLALALGWWGGRWALALPEHDPNQPDGRTIHAVIAGGSTLLAILVLAGNFGTVITLVVLALIGLLAWPLRGWLVQLVRRAVGNPPRTTPPPTDLLP